LAAKVWIVIDKDSEFLVIDKNLLMDDTEKDLTSSRCRGAVSRYRYTNVGKTPKSLHENKDIREKIVREIEKTAESIRKKHRLEDRQDRRRYRDQESF